MVTVSARYYAELNDFLPVDRRMSMSNDEIPEGTTVRDLLRRHGVPEDQVDLVMVNGESVGFGHLLQDGDRVSVYPVFESFDIAPLTKVRPRPLRHPCFVVDTHLGKLAAYLRLLGFDTLYVKDSDDDYLVSVSQREGRTLLSCDRRLMERQDIARGYMVREKYPRRQLLEVLHRFDLLSLIAPFQRCLRCNTPLKRVSKSEVLDRLPPRTRSVYEEFDLCPSCDRVYWKGSHYQRMSGFIQSLLDQKSPVENQRFSE